jgi:hypothetical protein
MTTTGRAGVALAVAVVWSQLGCSIIASTASFCKSMNECPFSQDGCFEEPSGQQRDWIVTDEFGDPGIGGCHIDDRVGNSRIYAFEGEFESRTEAEVVFTTTVNSNFLELQGRLVIDKQDETDPADDLLTITRQISGSGQFETVEGMVRCATPRSCRDVEMQLSQPSGINLLARGSSSTDPASSLQLFPPAAASEVPVPAPREPRFFGTYCDTKPTPLCKTVKVTFLGATVGSRKVCKTLSNVRVNVEHFDTPNGGLLTGGGRFELGDERGELILAGAVARTRRANVSARVPGTGSGRGAVLLSADGVEATVAALGERITVRKDACGNRVPVVSLTAESGSGVFQGNRACFRGRVTSDEDPAFPASRLVFLSDRDGGLAGATPLGARGERLCTTKLSVGFHRITFTATDSGGLEGRQTVTMRVHAPGSVLEGF